MKPVFCLSGKVSCQPWLGDARSSDGRSSHDPVGVTRIAYTRSASERFWVKTGSPYYMGKCRVLLRACSEACDRLRSQGANQSRQVLTGLCIVSERVILTSGSAQAQSTSSTIKFKRSPVGVAVPANCHCHSGLYYY